MEEALFRTMLFDSYGELLTEKQREYFDLHYNEDLSLAEIAQSEGVSRQSAGTSAPSHVVRSRPAAWNAASAEAPSRSHSQRLSSSQRAPPSGADASSRRRFSRRARSACRI